MKLDFFQPDDLVLLLGEGNFSFAVCLLKHNLPINVIATCFEDKILFENQEDNINYLMSKNVPVIFSVDATKLHDNLNFKGKMFNKIIFNFPHVGGKMKIHLNRDLLRKFFKSAKEITADNGGQVMVSLCRGQGGTPYDEPRKRKWCDSWQVSEMAGYGGFGLTGVEPFCKENFKEYTCIGYRSQDVQFNLNGALVHIFEKRKLPFDHLAESFTITELNISSLKEIYKIDVNDTYSYLCAKNPLVNSKSPILFIKKLLLNNLEKYNESILNVKLHDDSMSFLDINEKSNSIDFKHKKLGKNIFDVLDTITLAYNFNEQNVIFHSGVYFPIITGNDLFLKAPVELQFLIVGQEVSCAVYQCLRLLVDSFQEKTLEIIEKSDCTDSKHRKIRKYVVEEMREIICKDSGRELLFAVNYYLVFDNRIVNACVINADVICQQLFKVTSWKEIWGERVQVIFTEEGKPVIKPSLLFPLSYKFDVTLKYNRHDGFSINKMYEVLWSYFGSLIENVDFVNEYDSLDDWSSKCYRITYKSWDKPLCRTHILNIHQKLVIPLLESEMKVKIG